MANVSARRLATLLAITPGIGGKTLVRILARLELLSHSPDEFLSLSPEALQESYGIAKKAAASICAASKGWQKEASALELKLMEKNVRLITAADAHFPARLDEFDSQSPSALFCYGNLKLLDLPTFTVLSSRNTSRRGLEWIEKWTEEGVFQGEVLVTGHDRPEYQRAAVVPLRWGSPRILCFDRGIFPVLGEELNQEPFRAARLWRYEFDPKTDLAISPFRPESHFIGVNNQVRDRLVAGLSLRLDGVEVSQGGNMEKNLRLGIKAKRKVRILDRSEAADNLTKLGAELVACESL